MFVDFLQSRRRKTGPLFFGWAMMLSAPSLSADAEVVTLAYEGFDYLEGGVAAGAATGIGWVDAWGESGDVGDDRSELIIGPGNFSVPPGTPAQTGHHIDLNYQTGMRALTRRLGTVLGGNPVLEYRVGFVLDLGPGLGVDFAGLELRSSAGGPAVFLGKPAGAGPGNRGVIGIEVQDDGFVSSRVPGGGQHYLELRWAPNPDGPETLRLTVFDAATGEVRGRASHSADAVFDLITIVARRDLDYGESIPAFDEILVTAAPMAGLSVGSSNPDTGVSVEAEPADAMGESDGTTPFLRTYPVGTEVALTAPETADGNGFVQWLLDGEAYSEERTIQVVVSEDLSFTAEYRSAALTYEEWAAVHFDDPDAPEAQREADPDGDGRTNKEEFIAGTDPNDPASFFKVRSVSREPDGGLTLSWDSVVGRMYAVERTAALEGAQWDAAASSIEGTGEVLSYTDLAAPAPGQMRFYRVLVAPAP